MTQAFEQLSQFLTPGVAVAFMIALQFGAVIAWSTRLVGRVQVLETRVNEIDQHGTQAFPAVEARLSMAIRTLEEINKRLDEILKLVLSVTVPNGRRRK